MFRKILIAHDGSRGGEKAFRVGVDLGRRYGAELHCVAVAEPLVPHVAKIVGGSLRTDPDAHEYFRLLTIQAGLTADAVGVSMTTHVLTGHEVETIVIFVESHGFDLLVVGFMGHSRIFGENWGSTSSNLARLAPCSVLV